MKYTALVAVVAAVVSIPLAIGLAVAVSPSANTLSMTPQDDSGRGMMHNGGDGHMYQYQQQGSPDECPMAHDWEHDWDYNYSYNYSGSNCPRMC